MTPSMQDTATHYASTWANRLQAGDLQLHIHLIGIGGAGLSAIAQVLLEMGFNVSGSDRQTTPTTARLAQTGARIYPTQDAANLLGLSQSDRPDVVLISSAIAPSNPERLAAATLNLPVVKRDDFLPVLLRHRRLIAVAGAHGKTTTTGMIVQILTQTGKKPGYIIGAELPGLGNASAGESDLFVIEADEYDQMFLGFSPNAAVITNVEWDHPDCYPTPARFRKAFMQFVDKIDRRGLVISCRDDEGAEQLRSQAFSRGPEWITYGLHPEADLQATEIEDTATGMHALLRHWSMPGGELNLGVSGVHNVRNALAALAAAGYCDVPLPEALEALATFRGADRRFQIKGEAAGVLVIDDYAHHPSELRATLAAARSRFGDRRIWAVFQPHTYSRTRTLLQEMAASFDDADQVIVTDIYAAREHDDGSVSPLALVSASEHTAIRHISGLDDAAGYLARSCVAGDVVITLGAGDSHRIGEQLLEQLQNRDETQDGSGPGPGGAAGEQA